MSAGRTHDSAHYQQGAATTSPGHDLITGHRARENSHSSQRQERSHKTETRLSQGKRFSSYRAKIKFLQSVLLQLVEHEFRFFQHPIRLITEL